MQLLPQHLGRNNTGSASKNATGNSLALERCSRKIAPSRRRATVLPTSYQTTLKNFVTQGSSHMPINAHFLGNVGVTAQRIKIYMAISKRKRIKNEDAAPPLIEIRNATKVYMRESADCGEKVPGLDQVVCS